MVTWYRLATPVVSVLLAGCAYPLGDWQDKRTADAPWVAPHTKAIWQERVYQYVLIPAAQYRKRWVDADHKFIMTDYDGRPEPYLRKTPEWNQWEDSPPDRDGNRHKISPYHQAALVSLKPDIYLLWKDNVTIENRMELLGWVQTSFTQDWTLGVTSIPEATELWWFSTDLKKGPLPLERADERHSRISWADGRLLLTYLPTGWRVERE